MAKLSISIDDELAAELRRHATGNVSRFVARAVRDALDQQRLAGALAELDEEYGAVDDAHLDEARRLFDEMNAAAAAPAAEKRRVGGSPRGRAAG